jgi:hypothetical protein
MAPAVPSDNHDATTCGRGYFRRYTMSHPETLELISAILADDAIAHNRVAMEMDYDRMRKYFIAMWHVWGNDPTARTHRYKILGDRLRLSAEQAMCTCVVLCCFR